MRNIHIFVPLLHEAVDVWRPVPAAPLGGNLFLIRPVPVPDNERWEYAPGEIVRCTERTFADGTFGPVAVEAVPEEPATVQTWIELHDSVLGGVEPAATGWDFVLVPAHVHRWEWRAGQRLGTGWTQRARVRVLAATSDQGAPPDAGPLDGGAIETLEATYADMIPVPLQVAGPVRLSLQFSDGQVVQASGDGIDIDLEGDPHFVEALPADFDPKRDEPT